MSQRSDSDTHEIEDGLRDALSYTQAIVDTVREPLLVLDGQLRVTTASRAFYRTFGVSPEVTLQQFIYNLGNGQWNIPGLRTLLEEVLPQHKAFQDFEVVHTFPTIARRVMLLNARTLFRASNNTEHIVLAIEDITEKKRISDELVRSNEDLQRFAYVAAHDFRSPLNAGLNLLQLLARETKDTAQERDSRLLDLAIASFLRLRELMMQSSPTQPSRMRRRGVPSSISRTRSKLHFRTCSIIFKKQERQSMPVHCRASAPIVLR